MKLNIISLLNRYRVNRRTFLAGLMTWRVLSVRRSVAQAETIPPHNQLPQVTRGPYLQQCTPTSIIIRWRTDRPTDGQVRYGVQQGKLTLAANDTKPATDHQITVRNLAPQTQYYYSVGSSTAVLAGGDADHYFFTAPPVGAKLPTRIWVLGDSGHGGRNANRVRDSYYAYMGERHTDLWLLLGDNAYESGSDTEYQDAFFDPYARMLRTSPVWPAYGNHDSYCAGCNSGQQRGPYFDIFSLPKKGEAGGRASDTEAYYAFDYANIHFVCLDSMDTPPNATQFSRMVRWLDADLAATKQDWLIAFWHFPPYSKSFHDSDTQERAHENIRMMQMRERVLPILDKYSVDLVLCGHNHAYERSFLLSGHYGLSNTLTEAMIIDKGNGSMRGDGAYTKSRKRRPGQGTVYVIAGNSSSLKEGDLNHPAMHKSLHELGSIVLDTFEDRLHFVLLDAEKRIRDGFTIQKEPQLFLPTIHAE